MRDPILVAESYKVPLSPEGSLTAQILFCKNQSFSSSLESCLLMGQMYLRLQTQDKLRAQSLGFFMSNVPLGVSEYPFLGCKVTFSGPKTSFEGSKPDFQYTESF